MQNCHKVFYAKGSDACLLKRLDVDDATETKLRRARDIVRGDIRSGFRNWHLHISAEELLTAAALRARLPTPTLSPRFKMQGSYVYFTLNTPAHLAQQIDFDDGVYLPISYLKQVGEPIMVAPSFFRLIETILAVTCKREGWKLITDKASCVRVEIDKTSHLDLPLYAVPDERFRTIVESQLAKAVASFDPDSTELHEKIFRGLDVTEIHLAHREDGWIQSDPRKIEDWFKSQVAHHGEQLRRVCRYLKAWRDHNWARCQLSSITLMRCVVQAYDEIGARIPEDRDDQAILEVSDRLPQYFSAPIINPVIPDQVLNDSWSITEREDFSSKARLLSLHVRNAIERTGTSSAALELLRTAFGNRITTDTETVQPTVAPSLLAIHPTRVPKPEVPRTRSG